MDLTTAATALAGATVAAAYLDAKLFISKDLNFLYRIKKGGKNFDKAVQEGRASGFYLFEDAAHKQLDAQCIWSRSGVYTWRQTYERVCQYGKYFQSLGVRPGEYVGIYMMNSPEVIFLWMGLLSIGAAPALINYNLASDALVHCVSISGTKILISDAEEGCQARVQGSRESITNDLGVNVVTLSDELKNEIGKLDPSRPHRKQDWAYSASVPLALLYTSGTTGLPKAAPLSVSRSYASASMTTKTFGQRTGPDGDRTYICMPLYHGTGGLAAMNDIMSGTSIAIGRKFSLSNFWIDCIDSKSTIFLYVGETVRYLLSAPPSANDRKHQIRLIWGNGLSADIWEKFQERFGIPEVGEFFASTEGMLTSFAHCRSGFTTGAVGHDGWIRRRMFHDLYVPVEIDAESGDILRSPETGFAKRRDYDEGGEILVKMASEEAWAGYWGAQDATNKKLARDVFKKGDLYYRTGDALRRNPDGLWFFMDRLGDTYRWKGENVSTMEVSQAFGNFPGIQEANVFGVKLPNHDGRAGCAAVLIERSQSNTFDWLGLVKYLRSKLPRYAVPIFIRVVNGEVGVMSTHNNKQNKVPLKQEGVKPSLLGTKVTGGEGDQLYWLPPQSDRYIPFREEDWESMDTKRVRL
ncbi:putative NRPS-like protein biosynthetic cluster [Arachnomyces sp. PD_36]|nr:putative NRPS-like protein biosynthetic cluster [Arachnomyces sp. PD_36]